MALNTSSTLGRVHPEKVAADLQLLISELNQTPWLEGRLLEDVTLASGANVVRHNLGRVPKGWWLVRFSGAAASDYPRDSRLTTSSLTLTVTNAAVASIWVY